MKMVKYYIQSPNMMNSSASYLKTEEKFNSIENMELNGIRKNVHTDGLYRYTQVEIKKEQVYRGCRVTAYEDHLLMRLPGKDVRVIEYDDGYWVMPLPNGEEICNKDIQVLIDTVFFNEEYEYKLYNLKMTLLKLEFKDTDSNLIPTDYRVYRDGKVYEVCHNGDSFQGFCSEAFIDDIEWYSILFENVDEDFIYIEMED